MPLYHVDVELEIDGATVHIAQVVDCKSSDPGRIRVDIQRLVQKGESTLEAMHSAPAEGQIHDRRQYAGEVSKLDLILGDVPRPTDPEPITDRRGAIRDQKARNG